MAKDYHEQFVMMGVKCVSEKCKGCKYMELGVEYADESDYDDENYIYCKRHKTCLFYGPAYDGSEYLKHIKEPE